MVEPVPDEQLPHFRHPPVVEVALSIQFEAVRSLTAMHLGVFWERHLRDRYPAAEAVPPLPLIESFDSNPSPNDDVQFVLGPFPAMRHWLISADNSRLVQIQQDRLIVNWRKIKDEDAYPRYTTLREELQRVGAVFQSYVEEVTNSSLPPVTQTEVTYVNRIPIGGPVRDLSDIGAVLSDSNLSWTARLGAPEQLKLEQSFRCTGPEGQPARLYVSAQPAPDAEALMLILTMRGLPGGGSTIDALTQIDFAHQHIVQGFVAMTTPTLQAAWGEDGFS